MKSGELSEPRVLKALISRRSLVTVVGEERTDKALCVLGDSLPDAIFERELAFAHALHDLLVRLTIERRHAREENVGDDTR